MNKKETDTFVFNLKHIQTCESVQCHSMRLISITANNNHIIINITGTGGFICSYFLTRNISTSHRGAVVPQVIN